MAATTITHTTRISFSSGSGGSTLSGTIVRSGDNEDNYLFTVPASTTNELVTFRCDVSQVQSLIFMSDGGALTLNTNSSSVPIDVITLADGVPQIYFANAGMTNPLTVDVTALYVTNGTTTPVELTIKLLLDSAP